MEIPPLIFEESVLDAVSPEILDSLWADGWRHFGCRFFRYSITSDDGESWRRIIPLRIDLADFRPTKSQRRVLRRNLDVTVHVKPATVDARREELFRRHTVRFTTGSPDALGDFMPGPDPSRIPCECREVQMWLGAELIAVSYLDVGRDAVSSVYAVFDPAASARSPGIFTLLQEIEFARSTGRRFLYLGYATIEPSRYDYKKQFHGLHRFDWRGNWHPLAH